MGLKKITSLRQLEELGGELREKSKECKARVLVCMTGCRALGAESVAEQFRKSLAGTELGGEVAVVEVFVQRLGQRQVVLAAAPTTHQLRQRIAHPHGHPSEMLLDTLTADQLRRGLFLLRDAVEARRRHATIAERAFEARGRLGLQFIARLCRCGNRIAQLTRSTEVIVLRQIPELRVGVPQVEHTLEICGNLHFGVV